MYLQQRKVVEKLQKKKMKLSFGVLLVILTMIPMCMLTAVSLFAGIGKTKSALEESNKDSVEAICYSLMEAYDTLYEGDWSYIDGVLYKGENNVMNTQGLLNRFHSEKSYNVTLFYGDVRILTTLKDADGNYIVGTKADPAIAAQVLGGEGYFHSNYTINGVPSYVAYEPLSNEDGTTVGMVFVGYPRSVAQKHINSVIMTMALGNVIVFVVILIVVIIVVRLITKAMKKLSGAVTRLGEGDLNVSIQVDSLNSGNELGLLADNVNGLVARLREIISGIQRNADLLNEYSAKLSGSVDTTVSAIEQVGRAIEEVSEGSTTQAQDTAGAMANIQELNATIDVVTDKVVMLAEKSDQTMDASKSAKSTMEELIDINMQTKGDIDNIVTQSEKNVEAVNKINAILKAIEEISSQTNLLSLNASIEAARAGEAGRGFAVVAKEIGSLAESSASAAREIQEIIVSLVDDIQRTSSLSGVLDESASRQIDKLQDTKKMFDKVMAAVQEISGGTDQIRGEMESIGAVKDGIGGTIESLSAISQENAAASEETTASTSLVNEDMKEISKISHSVTELAEELKQLISYFR